MSNDIPASTTTPTIDWAPGPLQDRVEYIGVLLAIWNEGGDRVAGRRAANDAHLEIDRALRELRELRRQIDGKVRDDLVEAVSGR